MQLPASQLHQHLQGQLQPLYAIHGDEALLVQEAAQAIRDAARQRGFGERSVFTVDSARFDWTPILAAGNSLSLFAERQLLEIRLPTGKPGREGGQILQQIAASAASNENTLYLITLPQLNRRTQSGAWFSSLQKAGTSVAIATVDRRALPRWIAERLAAQKQRVASGPEGQRTLQFFADSVEGNLMAAHQEISKLALLYPEGELSWDQVRTAVLNVAHYDVFKLPEAALAGRPERVQTMLDGLRAEGVAAVLVHWVLAEDIRTLNQVKQAMQAGQALPMVLRKHRVWGLKEKLYERILPRLSTLDLLALLRSAHQADAVIKGLQMPGWPQKPWFALEKLAFELTRLCRQATVH